MGEAHQDSGYPLGAPFRVPGFSHLFLPCFYGAVIDMEDNIHKINPPQVNSITFHHLTWTDISFPTLAEASALAEKYKFHPLSLDDSLSRSQLSKIDGHGTYLLLVLHFPVVASIDTPIKSTWMCAFVGNNFIVTLHDEFKALSELFAECQNNEKTKKEYFVEGSGYLFYRIMDDLFRYCLPILDKLINRMGEIEDSVFDEAGNDTQEIATLRRNVISMRRIIGPSRLVIHDLKSMIKPYTAQDLDIYFDSLLDRINRIWENLEEAKEVVEVFKDSDFVLVTNRINRIVQTLTIISSIVLPFLVVSSLYGMNIDLPGGLQHGNPASFVVLLGIMFTISGTMLYFFRRKHWI
jgi:magnesium transporter